GPQHRKYGAQPDGGPASGRAPASRHRLRNPGDRHLGADALLLRRARPCAHCPESRRPPKPPRQPQLRPERGGPDSGNAWRAG
ncbi:MAG: hypothetical protein AVDCRST_MAG25-1786, partial [uncultured Rubrobacteraceae bacterium]